MDAKPFQDCNHDYTLALNFGGPIVPQYVYCFDCKCILKNKFGNDYYDFERKASTEEVTRLDKREKRKVRIMA
jgi:hypothetical protein